MVFETNLETAAESAETLPSAEEALDEHDEIPLTELFSDEFLTEYTDFDTFDGMVAASPSPATSADELELVPGDEWNAFVAETTDFEDEREMLFAVRDYWVASQLGL
ncbi:hypothetical protein [Halocatena marina]|uniref:hypothetical protein n=1 Tax=Halocatena marina TaxID=2934937 RepID=UPI00200D4245|nr:hypothetical protein [Halocatena marina]